MAPQASFLILNRLAMHKLHLAENYLVVSYYNETTKSAEFNVLDIYCQHNGVETCKHRRQFPVGQAWDFDSCGDMMAVVVNENQKIGVWDLKAGTLCLTLNKTSAINCILFPDPTTIILGAYDGGLIVWDVLSGIRRHTLKEGHSTRDTETITALKVHNNLLVSGNRGGNIQIWDLNNGQSIRILEGHNRSIMVLEFNSDYSLLATGASGGEIKIWDVNSSACIATCHGHTLVANQLSTDPEDTGLLVSASADGWIRTWEWNTGTPVRTFWAGDNSAERNAIRGVVWTKELMVTGAVNGLLRAWDRQTNQVRFDLRVRQGSVHHVAIRGDLLAVVAWFESGKHLIELYNISALD
ncbi:WD40 repeat-like protein [Lepidopterella palustris CBS 459.81]|uniref:WD40 repeat-like protein n=1 Tax=Lepidopterella palustris CBS 459.81 TaxID=1314670 RepID=A0A8E2DZJ4_9PEZI|nr:WD40 repeat-like protein [Lepidopterella palustris CBS 459.81]